MVAENCGGNGFDGGRNVFDDGGNGFNASFMKMEFR